MHEKQMHERSCFITLTYNDAHLPENGNLKYEDFQGFLHRLRWHFKTTSHEQVRYYMGGEYGSEKNTERPHYHAALFGVDFDDRKFFKTSPSGARVDTSETLDKIWGKGYTSVGDLTYESANYIARYIMKKRTGKKAKEHYKRVNLTTGEVFYLVPEFNKMSLKPGIGATWYEKYKEDVYKGADHFEVVMNGQKHKPPRYYAKLLEKESPMAWNAIKEKSRERANKPSAQEDNTSKRLATREIVETAKMNHLKRGKLE